MQNNNPNQQQQQPVMPPNGTPASQQQYRAAMQQQQMAAMARLHQQQGASAGGTGPQQAQQQQQNQAQQGGNNTSGGGSGGNPATQAQVQLLQQLFHTNPERLAEFVALSKEGKISPEHIAQLRGAVAAQQAQQQARVAASGQQVRPPQPVQQHQQPRPSPAQAAPQNQALTPQQPQQSGVQQPQAQQQPQQQMPSTNRPPEPTAPSSARGGPNVTTDFGQIMQSIQKAAEPVVRRVKELESILQKPVENGGISAEQDRAKLEAELADMKHKQLQLGHKYLTAKAQLLQQKGNNKEAQQIMQSLQQRAAAAAGAVRPAPRPSGANATQQQGVGAAGGSQGPAAGPAQGSPATVTRPSSTSAPAASAVGASSTAGAPAGSSSSPAGPQSSAVQVTSLPAEAMVQRPSGNMSQMGTSVPTTLSVSPSVPEPYPNAAGPRPTLSQGLGTNPLLGTPAILQRPEPVPSSAGAVGTSSTVGAASQTNGWEELLGVAPREGLAGSSAGPEAKLSNANTDELAGEMANPSFWDNISGRGTGAESLLNAGSASTTQTGGSGAAASDGRLLTKRKVQELMGEIDPNERLEGAVEDLLLEVADEFIDSVTQFACRLAKHRKGDRLEVRDVQLHLERSWNLRIPTPGSVPIPPPRIKTATQQSGATGKSGGGAGAASATQ